MSDVELFLDDENELIFKVQVEGASEGNAEVRYLIENNDYTITLPVNMSVDDNIVISIPPLKSILKEGIYDTSLEVIVDDRYFKPLDFKAKFSKSVVVTAEAVQRTKKKKPQATASLITSNVTVAKKKKVVEEKATVQNTSDKSKDVLSEEDIKVLINFISGNRKNK